MNEDSAARLRSRWPQSAASAQHRQPASRCRPPSPPGISPPRPWKWNSWQGPRARTAAAPILLPFSRRRLRPPNQRLPRNKGHQRQNGTGAASRQPRIVAHNYQQPPPPYIHAPAPHPPHHAYQHHQEVQIVPPPPPPPHQQHQNIPHAPKQEDFADQPYRGVIHMITGGVQH
jgi:hypothetical protein